MIDNLRRVSFHETQKQSSSVKARRTLSKLRMICTGAAAECPATWSHPDLSELASKDRKKCTKWVITKGRDPEHRDYHIWDDTEILRWLLEDIL
jgi:hypothetical protein